MRLLSIVPVLATCLAEVDEDFNIPKGWRMQDRFHGFRYEAHLSEGCASYAKAAQGAADELACFGWAQWGPTGDTVVGEGRCSKVAGGRMIERLREGPGGDCVVRSLDTRDYEDTKIKLHFSHFKILDTDRRTCFRESPHQCPEFQEASRAAESCENGDGDGVEEDKGEDGAEEVSAPVPG